jgi:hypothetical protein
MPRWQNRIDVREEHRKAAKDEITPHEYGQIMAEKLKAVPGDSDLLYIRDAFAALPESATWDDFDVPLERLYNWGDYNHRLWVATF